MKSEIAGFGSVVLLDYFNIINPSEIRLNQRYINTNFPSQFSNKAVGTEKLRTNKLTVTQKDILLKDFEKKFVNNCISNKVDFIVFDFVNERLPLIKLENGALLTYSNELKLSGFLSNSEFRIINPYSKEYFEIWAACWDSFVKKAKMLGFLDKIIINKVFWAKITVSAKPFPPPYNKNYIYQSNVYLYQLYAYCSKDISKENFLEYLPDDFLADDTHRWGVAPYHYTDSFYRKMSVLLKYKLSYI